MTFGWKYNCGCPDNQPFWEVQSVIHLHRLSFSLHQFVLSFMLCLCLPLCFVCINCLKPSFLSPVMCKDCCFSALHHQSPPLSFPFSLFLQTLVFFLIPPLCSLHFCVKLTLSLSSLHHFSWNRLIFMFNILKLRGNGRKRKGSQFGEGIGEKKEIWGEWRWEDILNNTLLSEGFPLINVKRKDRMKRKHIFDVWLWATLFGWEMFSAVKKRGVEERGRELMNEGGYKNRKPRGEGWE